jgi:hypothetical protein
MPIVNEDKNTCLQTKAPSKAFPKIQEIETLKTHHQVNRKKKLYHTNNGAHAKSMILLEHTTNLKHFNLTNIVIQNHYFAYHKKHK